MKKITPTLAFAVGSLCSLVALAIANLWSYPMSLGIRLSPKIGLLDDGKAFGFPFASYFVWAGLPRETAIAWPEALLNLLIAFLISALVGFLFGKWISWRASRD